MSEKKGLPPYLQDARDRYRKKHANDPLLGPHFKRLEEESAAKRLVIEEGQTATEHSAEQDVEIRKLTSQESPKIIERLLLIDADPRANRHLIDFDEDEENEDEDENDGEDQEASDDEEGEQPQIIELLSEGGVYGIFSKPEDREEVVLTSIAYFSEYEEEEDPEVSEDIPTLLSQGKLSEEQIPRLPGGGIDYTRVIDVSVFIPDGVSLSEVGKGLRASIEQYKAEQNFTGKTLFFFFQLKDQGQSVSAAWGDEHVVSDDQFFRELQEERKTIEAAGFTYRGDIEGEDIGMFTLSL